MFLSVRSPAILIGLSMSDGTVALLRNHPDYIGHVEAFPTALDRVRSVTGHHKDRCSERGGY
jgi:hypothetical protein